ncbi:MAG TPA: hypothetical protein VGE27_03600 [Gemmatimonas sp.]|uniref:hypothetical protein n=1 Tax=Gemmatimonas sp. TaxID=1962908 RepID=UPI002ED9F927
MAIRYMDLGGGKRVNEIVMVGTHDAGIMGQEMKDNVQTQTLNIGQQAIAGVRFFDIRVAATTINVDGVKHIQMKTFHADGMFVKNETKKRMVNPTGLPGQARMETVTRSKLKMGDWGLSLHTVLSQALAFVQSPAGNTEFLLLKFDKCTNWTLIAEACIEILGANLYQGGGNINRKTLNELAGKVVVLFSDKGYKEHKALHGVAHPGILKFANLAKADEKTKARPAYQTSYDGLQYYGNFGDTAMKTSTEKKIKTNTKKQITNMTDARLVPPDAVRMMYWTTTGLMQSIKERDDEMWRPPNLKGFLEAWNSGMGASVSAHAPPINPNVPNIANAQTIKIYMPNIVMVDFAHISKSTLIYELNKVAAGQLSSDQTLMAFIVKNG